MQVIAAALLAASLSGTVGLQRLDVISQDPGTFLHYDVPMAGAYPTNTAVRFVEQLKLVVDLPMDHFALGISLQSQSLSYERALLPDWGLFWDVGLQTRLLMPAGLFGGLAWRKGMFRVGLGATLFCESTWARPSFRDWTVLPTLGLGIGRAVAP